MLDACFELLPQLACGYTHELQASTAAIRANRYCRNFDLAMHSKTLFDIGAYRPHLVPKRCRVRLALVRQDAL